MIYILFITLILSLSYFGKMLERIKEEENKGDIKKWEKHSHNLKEIYN